MESAVLLEGKKVLLVDDEHDVLEALEDDLAMCEISTASNFRDARELLETEEFDIAVFDIMGVNGYKLLEIANQKKTISIMLTAHALSPKNAFKSHTKGAASYVPKDRINEIRDVLAEILEAKKKGRSPWWHWYDRFGAYFGREFGKEWVSEGEFWKEVYVSKWEKYY